MSARLLCSYFALDSNLQTQHVSVSLRPLVMLLISNHTGTTCDPVLLSGIDFRTAAPVLYVRSFNSDAWNQLQAIPIASRLLKHQYNRQRADADKKEFAASTRVRHVLIADITRIHLVDCDLEIHVKWLNLGNSIKAG